MKEILQLIKPLTNKWAFLYPATASLTDIDCDECELVDKYYVDSVDGDFNLEMECMGGVDWYNSSNGHWDFSD